MKSVVYLITVNVLLLTGQHAIAQSAFDDWDQFYKLVNIQELLKREYEYKARTEENKEIAQYYLDFSKVRFLGKFNGEIEKIPVETKESAQRSMLVRTGNQTFVNEYYQHQVKIYVNEKYFWMPIQKQLLASFKSEVEMNKNVLLYCFFALEHSEDGELKIIFLISDFATDYSL